MHSSQDSLAQQTLLTRSAIAAANEAKDALSKAQHQRKVDEETLAFLEKEKEVLDESYEAERGRLEKEAATMKGQLERSEGEVQSAEREKELLRSQLSSLQSSLSGKSTVDNSQLFELNEQLSLLQAGL